jgi:AmmeMemoRadiSam system protein B/AmmeMemoRadiSam system protein A
MAAALVSGSCTCAPSFPGLAAHRPAEFAGAFYEPDSAKLALELEGFLREAEPASDPVAAVVVPHAGHSFSGPLIARALGAVRGRSYRRIVEISDAHQALFEGAALPAEGGFDTPLGPLKVDSGSVELLVQYPHFARRTVAFDGDHALEVIHPFLRHLWPEAELVPVLVGQVDAAAEEAVAGALRNVLDEETLLVATTTLTHFSREAEGRVFSLSGDPEEIRSRAFEHETPFVTGLLGRDAAAMRVAYSERPIPMCGRSSLSILVRALGPGADGAVVGRATSLESFFDPAQPRGVSYIAALFPGRWPAIPALDPEDRLALGAIAEEAVAAAAYRRGERRLPPLSPRLRQRGGAFVTIQKRGQLKGCMGHLQAESVALAVQAAGRMAASSDPRFRALEPEDLGEMELEISVVGPFRTMSSPEEFEPGRHGIALTLGANCGLLLPQVATKYGMDREAFLNALSEKAGLAPGDYRSAELARFGVDLFNSRPAALR